MNHMETAPNLEALVYVLNVNLMNYFKRDGFIKKLLFSLYSQNNDNWQWFEPELIIKRKS